MLRVSSSRPLPLISTIWDLKNACESFREPVDGFICTRRSMDYCWMKFGSAKNNDESQDFVSITFRSLKFGTQFIHSRRQAYPNEVCHWSSFIYSLTMIRHGRFM